MTRLRSRAIFVTLVLATTSLCSFTFGQEKQLQMSDLAGEWELVIPRGERYYRGGSLSVKVRGEEVEIVREFEDADGVTERKLTYFADGRGELNFWVLSDGKTEIDRQSKSKWKKNKLVINWSQNTNRNRIETEEVYKLSPDGQKLTHSVNTVLPRIPFHSPFGSIQELTYLRKKQDSP